LRIADCGLRIEERRFSGFEFPEMGLSLHSPRKCGRWSGIRNPQSAIRNLSWPEWKALIFLQTQLQNERLFEWGALPPAWVVFLLLLPAVLLVVSYFYRRERPAGGGRGVRWVLGGLRAAVILALLAMLAQPMLREVVYQTREPQIMVLVDDSLSMKIKDKYADRSVPDRLAELLHSSPETVERTSRYDLVAQLLKDRASDFLGALRKRGKLSLWSFAASPRKLDAAGQPPDAPPAGGELPVLPEYDKVQGEERVKQTRLGDSIAEAVWGGQGPVREDPAGACVVLFTDGQQNSGTLQPEDLARKLGQRGVPVYSIGVGNPELPRDVRVAAFEANEMVLVGDRVPFDATVVADGYDGERVRVDLIFDGEVVDTQYVTLAGNGERQTVSLTHVPKAPGNSTAMVRVEPLPSELFEENNVASKSIQVLDQKIKVLYLEGPPRWEYRYLAHALIRDPTMEAQVLLYSADKDFFQESSPGVPALRAFPEGKEKLFQYHVVILGDVDPDTDKLTTQEMDLLKDFVSDAGGGVVFIAGQNANPSRYLHTPLEQLLPVEVPAAGRGAGESRSPTERFNVKLTGVGKELPVMRLDNDPARNVELWENPLQSEGGGLPAFYWFAEVNREKVGAVKLAVHTKAHPIYGPYVIFAFQNFGKGRTFFSAVDNTWRWRAGVDNLYFYKFWRQVIRFAASGRMMAKTPRFSITTDKLNYIIGDKINISCRVFDANMNPSTDETVKVFHQVETGSEGRPRAPEVISLPLVKGKAPGTYEGTITADKLGRHELWLGSAEEKLSSPRSVVVEVPALENRDLRMNRELLKKVAELSGGKYYDLPDYRSVLDDLAGMARQRQTPIDERLTDLWDNFWVLLVLTCLLAGEWIYRKMVKLL
jgi:hypothetical protein